MSTDNQTQVLAAALPSAITNRESEHFNLLLDLVALDGITCTGVPHWRDKEKPKATPKLYINHSIDQACPLHGQPKRGKRLRVYIGTDPTNQRLAGEAIEREQERKALEKQVHRMESLLAQAKSDIKSALSSLGYSSPADGSTPEPDITWPKPGARRGW